MNEYQLELNKNIAIQNRVKDLGLVIDEGRQLIAKQLGVSANEIALMRNGTEGNNNVNNGQILQPTDEVHEKVLKPVIVSQLQGKTHLIGEQFHFGV